MPVLYRLRRGRRLLVNFCSCVLQNTIRRFQKTDGCGSGNLCCYQASCCRYFSSCFALFRSGLWCSLSANRDLFSLKDACVCADVKASVCMWKCLLLKPPPTLYIVYLWGGLQHFGAYNPFSVLNTPTLLLSPCRARTLNLQASLRPFPPPPPPNTSTAPARLRWR